MPIKFNVLDKRSEKVRNILTAASGSFRGDSSGYSRNMKYTTSDTVKVPITKYSQFAGSGANVTMTQPMFFSPLHTPQNWQIASKRRECYQWARFYYENEPKVAAAIDFYGHFPINGFKLECKDKKVLKFFEKLVKDLQLNAILKYISHEYHMIGDVFPFIEMECPICGGGGVLPTGESCRHPGGKIKRIVILNPDWIEAQKNSLAPEPVFSLIPDEELRMLVQRKKPEQIYKRLPPKIIGMIVSGLPIPLSNRCISHLRHNAAPYGVYGTSMLRRLFTILAYKTKLMTANWIIAERLVLPVRVVKIGDKERPATPDDIADVSAQLSAVANDPNLTLITHHAFEYEWFGACNSSDTKALCKSGWKNYWEVTADDEIMVFDSKTGKMRYEKPLKLHEYDYDGEMVKFFGNKMDMLVTPSHKMLGYKRDLKTAYTMQAKDFAIINECDRYVRCVAEYDSAEQVVEEIDVCGYKVPIDDFLRFAGYYLSEGHCEFKPEKRRYIVSIGQSPSANPEYCEEIDEIMPSLGMKFSKYAYEGRATTWNILMKDVARQIGEWFGHNSNEKKIPNWIKNLPPEKLMILAEAYCKGDASKYVYDESFAIQAGTNSKNLADDMLEVLFKCGLSPVLSQYRKGKQYVINCNMTDNGKGRFPRIKDDHVSKEYYKGKVWCFETSTGFFVTMRNGKIAIQGNSGKIHNITAEMDAIGKEILDGMMLNQSLLNGEGPAWGSAQVGVEALIRRLQGWQNILSEWIEQHIFLPVSMMQGFRDDEESEMVGEEVWLKPTIKWNDLNLRDNSNKMQMFMQMNDKGLVSNDTLLKEFGLSYDDELQKIREEMIMAGPQGQLGGQEGGGMGGMGGGGGGAPMDMGGGGAPGAPGGAPGAPGGEMGGAPGMEGMGGIGGMGGGMGGAPGGAPGMPAAAEGFKVTKRGKGGKSFMEQMQEQQKAKSVKMPLALTKLESQMYNMLSGMKVPYNLYGQYKVQVPGQQFPFNIDFAYPAVGVGIEADGQKWHEDAESKARDKARDVKLANIGWRIMRFNENAIEDSPAEVQKVIYQQLSAAEKEKRKRVKAADADFSMIKVAAGHIILDYINQENVIIDKEILPNNLGCVYLIGTK